MVAGERQFVESIERRVLDFLSQAVAMRRTLIPSMIAGPEIKPKDGGELDFLLSLHIAIMRDVERQLCISLKTDRKVITRRVKSEGIAFLTKTLPNLFKDVLSTLESGVDFIGTFSARAFGLHWDKSSQSQIPTFLQGIVSRVFSKDVDVAASAIRALYQVCVFLAKYEAPVSTEVIASQIAELIEDDASLPDAFDSVEQRRLACYASQALSDLLGTLELAQVHPRSGRGAVYPAAEQWEKYYTPFDSKLEEYYDSGDYLCPSPLMRTEGYLIDWEEDLLSAASHEADSGHRGTLTSLDVLRPDNNEFAKLASVPKTQDAARLINVENALRMRYQQGQRAALYDHVESHPLTAGHVCFTQQDINGQLALAGSESGEWGTLDLKKASDLNGLALVRALWPSNVTRKLEATRTESCYIPPITLPSGKVIPARVLEMKKFAPMGSAVCFPVEALTFWAIACAALIDKYYWMGLTEAASRVYVYGDDIVVPSRDAVDVIGALELFGLKVNRNKSFWRGPFRESCGVDAFSGRVVTPVKLKKRIPQGVGDAESLIGWIGVAENLYKAGYIRTAWLMKDHVETILGDLPYEPDGRNVGWSIPDLVTLVREKQRSEKQRHSSLVYLGKPIMPEGHSMRTLFGVLDSIPAHPDEPAMAHSLSSGSWYQGKQAKRWRCSTPTVSPDFREFAESDAYLRWWEPKPDASETFDLKDFYALKAETMLSSSRDFSRRHSLVLRKV